MPTPTASLLANGTGPDTTTVSGSQMPPAISASRSTVCCRCGTSTTSPIAAALCHGLLRRGCGRCRREPLRFRDCRTKLIFTGNVVNPNWTTKIEGDFSRNGGGFTLLDGWIDYNYGNGWQIKAGQFKDPLLREELIADENLQLVEALERQPDLHRRPGVCRASWPPDRRCVPLHGVVQ